MKIEKFPSYKEYSILYAKYLKSKPVFVLMEYAITGIYNEHMAFSVSILLDKGFKDKTIFDISGGSGRVSEIALKLEAKSVFYLDPNPQMLMSSLNKKSIKNFYKIPYGIEEINGLCFKYPIDIAICRQSINYWFSYDNIKALADKMQCGGIFVFNTFNTPPGLIPVVKQYEFEQRHYTEVSWIRDCRCGYRAGKKNISHVQICENIDPHFTQFEWIEPDMYDHILSQFFSVARLRRDKTDLYRCVKK